MQQRGFIAVVFVIGCATGGVASQFVAPPARAQSTAPRWEYFCAQSDTISSAQLTKAGSEGWELVGFAPVGFTTSFGKQEADKHMMCMKRPL